MEYNITKKVVSGTLKYTLVAGYEFADRVEMDTGTDMCNLINLLKQFDGKKVSITVEPLDDLEYEGY
jgi:hypothetical protein